jgi:hypothetical protein
MNSRLPINSEGKSGDLLHDRYFVVKITAKFKGPVLNYDNYEADVSITNKHSTMVVIRSIILENHSRFYPSQHSNGLVYFCKYDAPIYLMANETTTVKLPCSTILPSDVVVDINHSKAADPSKFKVTNVGELAAPAGPVHLLNKNFGLRFSHACEKLDKYIRLNQKEFLDYKLLSASPLEKKDYLYTATGLLRTEVHSWSFFIQCDDNKYYVCFVNRDNVAMYNIEKDRTFDNGRHVPFGVPKYDNVDAIIACDDSNIIYNNIENYEIRAEIINNKFVCYWSLPYIGVDGLPIYIDANTLAVFRPHFRDYNLPTSSTITVNPDKDDPAKHP